MGRLGVFVLAALGGPSIQYVFRALGLIVRSGLGVVEAIVSQLAFIPAVSIEMTVCIIIAHSVHSALPGHMRRKPQIFTSNSNEEARVNS